MTGGQITAVADFWVIGHLFYRDEEESWSQVCRRWGEGIEFFFLFWIQDFRWPTLISNLCIGKAGFEFLILLSLSFQALGLQVPPHLPENFDVNYGFSGDSLKQDSQERWSNSCLGYEGLKLGRGLNLGQGRRSHQ